jgi:hypothetical protein
MIQSVVANEVQSSSISRRYMRRKLREEPSEWLDPEDEKYYSKKRKN